MHGQPRHESVKYFVVDRFIKMKKLEMGPQCVKKGNFNIGNVFQNYSKVYDRTPAAFQIISLCEITSGRLLGK